MPDARRGVPTPPIEFGPDPDHAPPVTAHLDRAGVAIADASLNRLRDACGCLITDAETLGEASRDWWPLAMIWALDSQVAALGAALARPTSVEELQGVLRICDEDRIPATTSAGRSGVCGASVPVHGGLILDMCGLAGIVAVDHDSMVLDVRAGTFGDVLEDELRAEHGVTVGHWPQSVALSTVGGWLACRGAGQYSTRYGKIEDIVVGLDLVLADGRHLRTGGAPRAAVGPDLTQLFVGSEGTLGVITSARLRLHRTPPATRTAAWGFPSFTAGLDACRRVLQRGATPAVLRLYDDLEGQRNFQTGDLHPLLVLDEGDPTMVDAVLAVIGNECRDAVPLAAELVARWLEHRNDVSSLEALIRRGVVVDTMEIAGCWRDLPAIYEAATSALRDVPGTMVASAHQSHSYRDGACLYFTFAGQVDPQGREAYYRAAWDAGTGAVLRHGGALSHHHGVGLNRARFVAEALGGGLEVLTAVKAALDPHGILNPGKLGLPSAFGPSPAWP